jgi:biotin carboxylase
VTNLLVVHPRLADLRGADLGRHEPLLRALGLRLILADHRPDPILARHFDAVLELPPPHEVEAGWAVLEPALGRHAVDALLAQTESGLPYGALAAAARGLRGPRPAAAYLCLDKHACRLRLAEHGLAQPGFVLAGDLAGAQRAAAELGFPLVLKGVASANQRLVTLVRDAAELAPAVARLRAGLPRSHDVARLAGFARVAGIELACDPRREFLVEAFAPGDPLESDGLVVGREVRSFGITAQIHAEAPSFFIEGYLTPAERPAAELARLEALTRAALAAVQLEDSGYSLEFRSHASASALIEVNGRLGCDEGFGDLFEAVLGAQPLFLAFLLALGAEPAFARRPSHAAVAYQSCYTPGSVRRVPGPPERAALERQGLRVGVNVRPGERTRAASDPEIHPHLAFVLAEDSASSRAAHVRARRAARELRFELEADALGASGTEPAWTTRLDLDQLPADT